MLAGVGSRQAWHRPSVALWKRRKENCKIPREVWTLKRSYPTK
jgi:hypothetical protein